MFIIVISFVFLLLLLLFSIFNVANKHTRRCRYPRRRPHCRRHFFISRFRRSLFIYRYSNVRFCKIIKMKSNHLSLSLLV